MNDLQEQFVGTISAMISGTILRTISVYFWGHFCNIHLSVHNCKTYGTTVILGATSIPESRVFIDVV